MHIMHAPVPGAAEAAARQTVRPAAAAGGLAPVREKHAQSERPDRYVFGKPASTCLNCRCRPQRHFERSFFDIVTESTNVEKTQSEEHQKIVFLQAK